MLRSSVLSSGRKERRWSGRSKRVTDPGGPGAGVCRVPWKLTWARKLAGCWCTSVRIGPAWLRQAGQFVRASDMASCSAIASPCSTLYRSVSGKSARGWPFSPSSATIQLPSTDASNNSLSSPGICRSTTTLAARSSPTNSAFEKPSATTTSNPGCFCCSVCQMLCFLVVEIAPQWTSPSITTSSLLPCANSPPSSASFALLRKLGER